ncbi:MAG: 50S ribosomal protein L21 [Acidobacteria bacterium]|nr:MAG: 50S ribosomal protein L21 [Acidobacteriota bacterium]
MRCDVYAIIQARGRQIKVTPGAVIEVDGTAGEHGKEFTFEQVLLVEKDAGDIVAGAPFVANAKVLGIVEKRDKAAHATAATAIRSGWASRATTATSSPAGRFSFARRDAASIQA